VKFRLTDSLIREKMLKSCYLHLSTILINWFACKSIDCIAKRLLRWFAAQNLRLKQWWHSWSRAVTVGWVP
jgi:hypothetical protein